jgi:carbonyl reductase 1
MMVNSSLWHLLVKNLLVLIIYLLQTCRLTDVNVVGQSLRNHYRKELANRERITEAKVDEFVESYLQEMKTGKGPGGWVRGGWSPSYCVSKMAVNAYMSVLAREMSSRPEGEKVYVNSFTPGYTSTDMTGNRGHTVEEGAMTGVWLALHPPRGYPVGKFWADKCRGEKSF